MNKRVKFDSNFILALVCFTLANFFVLGDSFNDGVVFGTLGCLAIFFASNWLKSKTKNLIERKKLEAKE